VALKTMINRINAAKAKYDAEIKKAGKNLPKEIAKELGKLVPDGFFLEWEQCTPYFNDGEPCVFSVGTPYLKSYSAPSDEPEEETDDTEVTAEPTFDGGVAGPGDVADASVEDMEAEAESEEDPDDEEPEEREWQSYDEDDLVFELYDVKWVDAAQAKAAGLTKKQLGEIIAAFKKLPEDLLEAAFGDHVGIRVYADGTYRCEEVDHD
jgi:hypothetical protein